MESINQAKLFAKIAAVMKTCRELPKSGENKFDRYNYVTADAIAKSIGSALAEQGVAFLPSLVSVETSEYTTQKGGTHFRTVAHFQMTLACTESGATWTSLWSGEAIDRSDKSISKAAVSATKYFLLKTFLVAGGDEDDADGETPVVEKRQQSAAAVPNGKSHAAPPADAPAPQDLGHDVNFDEPQAAQSDPSADKHKRASQAQLARLNILGGDLYGGEWDTQRPKLVEAVSKGAVKSSKELTPAEIDVLIKGMEKRLHASQASTENGKVAA